MIDSTYNNSSNLVSEELLNYTDPIVRHDGGNHSNIVVIDNKEFDMFDKDKAHYPQNIDYKKIYGKYYPLIKLNNLVVDIERIVYFKIDYTGFMPTLSLWIKDEDEHIKIFDMPTRNNVISVIIVPQEDGAYKKISLDFYTNTIPERDENIIKYIDCEYKLPNIYNGTPIQIKHKGCSSEYCKTSQNNMPNTYELFHDIALSLGLGYQTTKNVKEIQDRLPRNTQNFKLYEFMFNQISLGGLDENSIFDVWIDLYGYMTVVNVPWVLSQEITSDYLGIYAECGIDIEADKSPEQSHKLVNRTLTNYSLNRINTNLNIDNYEHILDYSKLNRTGQIRNYYMFNRAGDKMANKEVGGNNLTQINIQALPLNYSEKEMNEWQHGAQTIILTETNEYCTSRQKAIREMYFNNIRSQILKIKMSNYNLGLQRGTLINLVIFNNDTINKAKLLMDSKNLSNEHTDTISNDNIEELIMNDEYPIPDMSITGMYYIDGMEFVYDNNEQMIIQYLYLIPKKYMNRIDNKYSLPTFDFYK